MRCLLECDAKGITQRQLTDMMSSDPNTVASLLERMEKAGWVERRRHERDRRAYRIRLKRAGQRKYEELRDIAIDVQAELLKSLPEERREGFLSELATVADACRDSAIQALARE